MRALCLLLLLLTCLGGCFAPRARKSKWPPPDFFIEVEAGENTVDGIFCKQKLQIWADGLVVYRQATPPPLTSRVENSPGLPVYKSVCAYELATESIRMLSRMLYQSSIKDIPPTVGSPGTGTGPWLKMLYRSNGDAQEIMVHKRIFGPMNRVLHILNSFLPAGHGFTMPEMVGVPEDAHVVELPPVTESVEGALGFHRKMLDSMPRFSEAAAATDPILGYRRYQLQRDTFALACVHGDIEVAEQLFRDMANLLENQEKANRLFPDTKTDSIEHLRQILAATRHGRPLNR